MPHSKVAINFKNTLFAAPLTKNKQRAVAQAFGLFGGGQEAGPFYPGTNVNADVVPREEDFIYQPFRFLSATIVGGGTWKATDFSVDPRVLKRSVKLLLNKPVYLDHDLSSVLSSVGVITAVEWQEGFTSEAGVAIPAGINGVVKIDAKSNPRVARGLLSRPPQINSVSVTVYFEWEPSHTFEDREGNADPYVFEYKLGTIYEGKMVRRNVIAIEEYVEASLVSIGADPFARMLIDGQPVNISESSIVAPKNFADDALNPVYKAESKYFTQFCFSDAVVLDLEKKVLPDVKATPPVSRKKPGGTDGWSRPRPRQTNGAGQQVTMEEEILDFLADALGVGPEAVTADAVKKLKIIPPTELTTLQNAGKELPKVTAKLTALQSANETLTAEKAALNLRVTELEQTAAQEAPLIKFAGDYLKAKREEAKRLYRVSMGKNADEEYLGVIEAATDKQLNSILKQFGGQLTEQFTGVCRQCNSTDVEFRSTVADDDSRNGKPSAGSKRHLARNFV